MTQSLTSGGERRRVTIAEALTVDADIYYWDNATRGLDANTALSFARNCRSASDIERKINVVSLYQAGNAIYDLFDKVTVVAEGQVIYYGPRREARGYFEALGFQHLDGANTADYLTAVTALAERKVLPNFTGRVPNSASEFAAAFRRSDFAARMYAELEAHAANNAKVSEQTAVALQVRDQRRNKGVSRHSPFVANYAVQLKAALIREYQQRWADKW